jgi:hypothetical protein
VAGEARARSRLTCIDRGRKEASRGVPDSAPCSLIAAGFPASGRPGRGAQRPRSGAGGALDAAVREPDHAGGRRQAAGGRRQGAGGRGQGAGRPWLVRNAVVAVQYWAASWEQGERGRGSRGPGAGSASLTSAREALASRPGDMMMDRVSPRLRGDAAAQSDQAVRAVLAGRERLAAARRELAAVVPHLVSLAAVARLRAACRGCGHRVSTLQAASKAPRRARPGCGRPGG